MDDFTRSKKEEVNLINEEESEFPSFLFEPVFNEYDDGFYQKTQTEYEHIDDVLRLKRKYRDYFKWRAALDTYWDYMYWLEGKYGSLDIVWNDVEEGIATEDYIPPKPQLKKNAINKEIMKSGIVPARRIQAGIDHDLTRLIDSAMFGDKDFGETVYVDPGKSDDRAFQQMMKIKESKDRVANVKNPRHKSSYNGVDIVMEYHRDLQNKMYNESGKPLNLSISQTTANRLASELQDPEITAFESGLTANPISYMNGYNVQTEQLHEIEIMKELLHQGFSFEAMVGSTKMNKRALKMVRSYADPQDVTTYDLSQMSEKKRKKKMKKMRKASEAARESDRRIDDILHRNKLGNSRSELEFRLNNLFVD